MPSPFPGMDPYLEGSDWTGVHTALTAQIARQLAPLLRPKYVARPTRRFVTEFPEDVAVTVRDIQSDVDIGLSDELQIVQAPGVAVAPAPVQLATATPERVPHITVEIRDVARRELVAAIELLSPTNKRGEGYKEYLEKRRRLFWSDAHLIEIDLLRLGRRVPMQQPLPSAPYFIFVGRAQRRPILDVWPIQLPMRLPTVPVPLLAPDPDVPLDLQRVLTTFYDELGLDLTTDYSRPPEVPLRGAAAWAEDRLREAGYAPAPAPPNEPPA